MAIDLTAPLEEVWSYQQRHVYLLPVVADGLVFYGDSQRHTTAISEEDQEHLWQSAYKMSPIEWWGGSLIAYKHGGSIQVVEPRSGRVTREIKAPGGCIASSSGERWVAGAGFEEQVTIWCLDPREGSLLWSKTLEKGAHVTALVVAGDTVVYAITSGEVRAFDAPTGERRWTSTVADLGWRRYSGQVEPGNVRGRPSVFGDHVILNVFDHYVVSLALQDGSRAWTWGGPPFAMSHGQRLGGRYYVLGAGAEYRILDARSGTELFATNLQRQLPRKEAHRLVRPMLVTGTHILVGGGSGNVTAFARDTGAFAWTYRTKDQGTTEEGDAEFVVGRDRIYFGNSNMRIRCFGPRSRSRAARKST